MAWISLSLSSLWFTQPLENYRFMYFAKLGNTFLGPSYFSYPGIPMTWLLDLLLLFHRSFRIGLFFFHLWSPCCSDWVISIVFIFKVTDIFLLSSPFCNWAQTQWPFLFWLLYSSKVLIWLFLGFSISLWDFLFFHLLQVWL